MRRLMRERVRITHVMTGIGTGLTIKEIHYRTGLTEKNIRKIMMENPSEITFTLLTKENKNDKNKR